MRPYIFSLPTGILFQNPRERKMNILKVIFTSILSVIALFIITKLMGHKQVAQLDFFDYVCGITIGSIGAELATELEEPLQPLIALVIYCIASLLLSLASHKLPRTRKYINGTPTILFNSGKLYRKNLKQAKIDLSEFLLLCREQGYFDLDEIQTAVFEHNGKLSILPKAASRPVTPMDLKITAKATHIGTELIMDGRIMGENLSRCGRDKKWLNEKLRLQGYDSARDILLGIYQKETDTLSLYPLS
ncbi:MAG: DUF421 domain-containing protein [Ruminococcaceae bacterium]|nr:DUF421 domain-containing protein [Oscillospiraceae bacterium]